MLHSTDGATCGNWASAAQNYLRRLGEAEYRAFRASKAGQKKNARYQPTEYHAELCRLLGQDKEEDFKSLKALRGRDSALGV